MMTLERASELVKALKGDDAIHLFDHFTEYFNLKEKVVLTEFAELCGFPIAVDIVSVKGEKKTPPSKE